MESTCNGFKHRRRRQMPANTPTKRLYEGISLRGQFLHLTLSLRLTILAITCIGSAELNVLPTDCCRIPPCALLCVAVLPVTSRTIHGKGISASCSQLLYF